MHHGVRTRGRKKKNPELGEGMHQLARGVIFSYFQYLDRAVKEKSVVVEYLPKEQGALPVYNNGRTDG